MDCTFIDAGTRCRYKEEILTCAYMHCLLPIMSANMSLSAHPLTDIALTDIGDEDQLPVRLQDIQQLTVQLKARRAQLLTLNEQQLALVAEQQELDRGYTDFENEVKAEVKDLRLYKPAIKVSLARAVSWVVCLAAWVALAAWAARAAWTGPKPMGWVAALALISAPAGTIAVMAQMRWPQLLAVLTLSRAERSFDMFDAPPSQEAARPDHHTSAEAAQTSSLVGASATNFDASRRLRNHPGHRAAYEEAMQLMKAAEAESQAKHEQLMAQIDRERAARRAALWSFRLPPPFSPEVAAALKEARELLDQMMQEQERAAAEEQRQKKAEARRAALLERAEAEAPGSCSIDADTSSSGGSSSSSSGDHTRGSSGGVCGVPAGSPAGRPLPHAEPRYLTETLLPGAAAALLAAGRAQAPAVAAAQVPPHAGARASGGCQDLAVADEVKAYLTSELQEVEAQIAAAERAVAAKEAAATNAAAQRAKGRIELEKARKEAKADKKQLRWLAGGMWVLCVAAVVVLVVAMVIAGEQGQGKETGEDLVYGAPALAPGLQEEDQDEEAQVEEQAWYVATVAVLSFIVIVGFLAQFRLPERSLSRAERFFDMFDAPPSQEGARPDHHTSEEAAQTSSFARASTAYIDAASSLRNQPACLAAYQEAMRAVDAECQAKHDRLMAQLEQDLAARRSLGLFRLPPPFSHEVAAALRLAEELDQRRREQERAATEEQRQKAEQQKKACDEQRQKAEARRAALLEPFLAGVRQGCPLAPLLYLFIAQALLQLLKARGIGIPVAGQQLTALQYADDAQALLPSLDAVPSFLAAMDTFGCVIVHKPPGVPFHGTASQPGLLQLMRSQQGQDSFPYEGPLFPVHRLDYLTSGCLILATSSEAAGELVAAFRARAVHKFYVALSDRRPSKKMGSVVGDMQKGRRGSWKLARTSEQPSITRFTSAAVSAERPLRAFLLKPETGRTHQLRVALKSLGAPVLGDERYAQKEAASEEDRGYLHCAALRFELGGTAVQCVCPPEDGIEFLRPEFRNLFDTWLPQSLQQDTGPWFDDNKLLRSELQLAGSKLQEASRT
ncbi:putative RNA pseudouridine synthase [Chlorella vulgaris]